MERRTLMDVLERVREINRDAAPAGESEINPARQALLREIATAGRSRTRVGRKWILASALTAGVAVTVVAVSVLVPAKVDSAAAAVLMNAADVTITAIDTTLAPGQYLRIQSDDDQLWKWDADMAGGPEGRFNNGNRVDAEAAFVSRETRVLYVPADRSADWVWDWSGDAQVIETYGDRSSEATADWQAAGYPSDSGGYWPDIQALPGGETRAAEGDPNQYPLDSYRPLYDEMPRDPQTLLDWFRTRLGNPDVSDQWLVQAITEVLSANLMPADLRATMLRALALIPGIEVSSVDGEQTTLEYSSGDWFSTRTLQITIDTVQGMITSVAEINTDNINRGGPIPASTPDFRTTVSTTVVDTAPTP
jgi:hypothetical protein